MQRAPNSPALRTSAHALTGCGAFQRKSPTGGAANGTPRNIRTVDSSPVRALNDAAFYLHLIGRFS